MKLSRLKHMSTVGGVWGQACQVSWLSLTFPRFVSQYVEWSSISPYVIYRGLILILIDGDSDTIVYLKSCYVIYVIPVL